MTQRPLTTVEANEVYDVLVKYAGASEAPYERKDFARHQTREVCPEYRFMGHLGFGGKFWRGHREIGYVNCYNEDESSGRIAKIAQTNVELSKIRMEIA